MKKPVTISIICVLLITCFIACFYYMFTHDIFKTAETTEQTHTTTSIKNETKEPVNTSLIEESDTALESMTTTPVSIEETNDLKPTEKENEEPTENTTTLSLESLFEVSSETTNLKMGTIVRSEGFYVSLNCVRSLKKVQTAIKSYAEDISSNQEVIYPIIEVYNYSNVVKDFSKSYIAVYADSIQAAQPDTYMLVGVDDFKEYQSYSIDAKKKSVIITGFVVEKGWSSMTIFCGDVSWTITPNEISSKPYSHTTSFEEPFEYSITEEGSKVYSGDFDLIFDKCEIIEEKNVVDGKRKYAVFEFSLNNTSSKTLECGLWGYQMRGYMNSSLLDEADWTIDKIVNGYSNIFNVDEVRPGMTAKIYVCFRVPDKKGTFECFFDTGYIGNETIAYVCVNK